MILPFNIKEAISNNSLIIFTGAGLSKRFGLPDWKKMVLDILNTLQNETNDPFATLLQTGKLSPIDVLTFIQNEHTIISKYIKETFNIKSGDFSFHKKLIELSGQIITTNYDNAFEVASGGEILPTSYDSTFNISQINRTGENYILKLHGTFSEPDKCILFKSQYDQMYSSSETSVIQKLKTIFTEKTILFLGFSFNDPEINFLFNELDVMFGNNCKHYLVTREPEFFKDFKFLDTLKIENHNEVETLIDDCLTHKANLVFPKNESHIKNEVGVRRVAFLYPNPLDLNLSVDVSTILGCFKSLQMETFTGALNLMTLGMLDDFDLVIIVSKIFKNKIYIEDPNLTSSLLTINEISEHIPNPDIPLIFITDNVIPNFTNNEFINIGSYKVSVINRFIFKALRKNETDFYDGEIVFNHPFINRLPFQKRQQ